jgi:hypothetical protein
MWIDHHGYLWMPAAQLDQIATPFQGGVSRVHSPLIIYKNADQSKAGILILKRPILPVFEI